MFLPNSHSFLLVRSVTLFGQESATSLPSSSSSSDSGRQTFLPPHQNAASVSLWCGGLPNSHSFLLVRSVTSNPVRSKTPMASAEDSGKPIIVNKDKRTFLKVAGVAGASLAASLLLPKKADALIMGSSPTTGVVGVKNAANTRINPATQETVSTLLKPSDLTFAAGDLQVKVTSLPPSSFSDSGGVAKSGLVDVDRHVQVDVLSSALPTTASTETTLQTISFGGSKFALRLATVGSIDYVGEAAVGTLTSAASWRIKRVDSTTGIVIQWAGTGVFDQIWDNRASLSYS